MATHLSTTTSTPSRPVSLFSASNDYLAEALNGRCDQTRLVDALRDLMALYFVPNEPAEIRARQIALFVKDLGAFSDDCVFWALDEWRKTQDRRPSIASIRQLCMMRRAELVKVLETRRKPAPEPEFTHQPDPVKRAENLDRINAAIGMVKHKGEWVPPAYVAEVRAEQASRKRHWSETASADDPRWDALRKERAANPLMNPRAGE